MVHRFDLAKRKAEQLVDRATHVAVSDDGEKMLYQHGAAGSWLPLPSRPREATAR